MPASGSSSFSPDSQDTRPRNQRVSLACESYRSRKIKCDGSNPCSRCRRVGQECVFQGRKKRRPRKPESLPSRSHTTLAPPDNQRVSPVTTQALNDPVYFKKQLELRAGFGVSNAATGCFQFYGPSSHFSFIQRIYQRIKRQTLNRQDQTSATDVDNWGLERFMFSVDSGEGVGQGPTQAYVSNEMGIKFIDAFFEIVHPQMPVFSYEETIASWNSLWNPPRGREPKKGQEILYMMLALGAHLSHSEGRQDLESSEGWSEYFYRLASRDASDLTDTSLRSTHFMLLKSFYAFQVMKSHEAYIYLGHAARNALALGIHRAQVVEGDNLTIHRLRITFWTIYMFERSCSLFSGRPSSFRDELIDAPYPNDLPFALVSEGPSAPQYLHPTCKCAWIRSMAQLGKISDRLSVEIYSSNAMTNPKDILQVRQATIACDLQLQSITHALPSYLHFFDQNAPLGDGWQEVQRIMIGAHYYTTRMLLHRPALVFATLFDSGSDAEKCSSGTMHINDSIEISVESAKNLINLVYDVFFQRYPNVKFDGTPATFLVSACITLLYYVLEHKFDADYVRNTFSIVEKGIRCLDQLQHIGPTSGKAISLDIMKVAKDAFLSINNNSQEEVDPDFLRLQYVSIRALLSTKSSLKWPS
ncbi:hypothetical protein EURHEDRAFT_417052 [Aspergillus niger]|uniref:Zn(2)-C6 fungal-type domain-containing protein n=1 Tax=Aspergillus niger TaxID=5061 RepID=A0A124BVK2_ASPNG|nr:hypothetical protein EURHEDRAFT_417052 [Aspergillus niger]